MDMKISETAKLYNGALCDFNVFPGGTDRASYEKLPESLKSEIIKEGEKYSGFHFPSISASEYMEFSRSGNRVDFENKYFEKRHALSALTLAECVEYKGRFTDDIINGVFSVCEESGWQLPAHNVYIRDAKQLPLPDADNPVIDLFAAETGALLAYVYYLLGNSLDKVSSLINKRIISEIERRIIEPYTTVHFWWMGRGDEKMCNWTPWCTQNVLLSTFLLPTDDEIRRRVFVKAAESCDFFLKDYGGDGCCDEGAFYYRHAGLCLFGALNILNYVSSGAFDKHFLDSKIKNIALYIVNVHVSDEYYFNFADCAAKPGRCGAREYLFGKAVDAPALLSLAASDFCRENGRLYTGGTDQINLYYMLMTCFYFDEIFAYASNEKDNGKASDSYIADDIFYESAGLFIARSASFSLAVKAGHNDDNHNHNDTGSFILYKNGFPVFIDAGVESYTKKTFSDRRYEIWTMQSCYHNLPTIDGKDEEAGRDYCAKDVSYSFGELSSEISMDIISAYPVKNGSYKRTVVLDKSAGGSGGVMLTDLTTCDNAILNFMMYEKPVINGNTICLGSHTKCTFEGAALLSLEPIQINDSRLMKSWHGCLYRLRLKLTETPSQGEKTFTLRVV